MIPSCCSIAPFIFLINFTLFNLFYFVVFYFSFILFYFILFYLFYFILLYFILFQLFNFIFFFFFLVVVVVFVVVVIVAVHFSVRQVVGVVGVVVKPGVDAGKILVALDPDNDKSKNERFFFRLYDKKAISDLESLVAANYLKVRIFS